MCALGAEYTADYWFQKGNGFYYNGSYKLALDCYNKSIELDPQNADVWIAIGDVNSHQFYKYNDSLNAYDKAIKIDPVSVSAWIGKGNALNYQKKYDESIKAFDNAIAIDPNNATAWADKASLLTYHGKYNESIEAYNKAIQINPKNYHIGESKAQLLFLLGRYNESIATLDNISQINPIDIVRFKGVVFAFSGRYNESIAFLDYAIQMYPDNADLYDLKGDVFYRLGLYKAALESYNKSNEFQHPPQPRIWYKIGLSLQALGLDSDAQETFKKIPELGSSYAEEMIYKGDAFRLSGRYNESIEAYNKAIELGSEDDYPWICKIVTLRALHRDSEADAALQQSIRAKALWIG